MAHLQARGFQKQSQRQMQRAVKPGRTEHDLVRPLLGVVDQVLQRLVGCLIVDHEHHRAFGEACDRDEVGAGELGLAIEQLVHLGKSGDRNDVHEQRVAIGLGVGGKLRADCAGRAGLGVDHHRLLDDRLERRGEWPADHVGGAARRKRIDQCDRARRIGILRECGSSGEGRRGRAGDELASVHVVLPQMSRFLLGRDGRPANARGQPRGSVDAVAGAMRTKRRDPIPA